MKMTKTISLDADKSLGYGHLLLCCGLRQPVNIHELESGDVWHCAICDRPLMFKYHDQYFEIGENITI